MDLVADRAFNKEAKHATAQLRALQDVMYPSEGITSLEPNRNYLLLLFFLLEFGFKTACWTLEFRALSRHQRPSTCPLFLLKNHQPKTITGEGRVGCVLYLHIGRPHPPPPPLQTRRTVPGGSVPKVLVPLILIMHVITNEL